MTARPRDRGDTVEIRIRDNGTGIPDDVKEKMFNPFFTTKPAGEGTGLGLSMSHDIVVKQHGGTIDVATEPGHSPSSRSCCRGRAALPEQQRIDSPGDVLTGLARFIQRQLLSLSGVGLMLGALFFAAALTPTLIPRSYLTQGALAGGCFAIGYLAASLWRRLWHYLELPEPSARARSIANALVAAPACLSSSSPSGAPSNGGTSIRIVMKMAPVEPAHPLKVCAIALITFVVLLVLGRLFALVARFLAARIAARHSSKGRECDRRARRQPCCSGRSPAMS